LPDGRTLRVSTASPQIANNIIFSDNGRGMNDADQRRLFQPFRTNSPAPGLGMAISYRIVQEHGGRIDVSSHEGAGTSITVSLPAAATMGKRRGRCANGITPFRYFSISPAFSTSTEAAPNTRGQYIASDAMKRLRWQASAESFPRPRRHP